MAVAPPVAVRLSGHQLIEHDAPIGRESDKPHFHAAYVAIPVDRGRENDLLTAYTDDVGWRRSGPTEACPSREGRPRQQGAGGVERIQGRPDFRLFDCPYFGDLRLGADHIDRTIRADGGQGDDRLAPVNLPAPERFAVRMQGDKLSFLRAEIDASIGSDDRTRAQRERAEAGNAEGAPGSRLRIHIGEPPIGGVAMETFPGANRRSCSLHDRATHRGGCNSDE